MLGPTNSTAGPNSYQLYDKINGPAVGGVAGSIGATVGSTQAGFFQGSTAFIGSPPNQTPNYINEGVWTRDAAGFNIEKSSVAATSGTTFNTPLSTITHFHGEQVGGDFAIFNMGGSGWNFHGGLTGGEYDASSSGNDDLTSFRVPFIGAYAAVTGHGFNANLLVRHDFWYGNISSGGLSLENARMNGEGNAVTAEVGYQINLQNGMFLKPTAGFSYNRASFDDLNGTSGIGKRPIPYTLTVGPVVSELGVISLQAGYPFQTGDWALIPNAVISGWHEFAGAIPGQAFSANTSPSTAFDFALAVDRVGTFGQVGVGVAASPLKMPNFLMYLRADYRQGENITGGTFTFGARYTF